MRRNSKRKWNQNILVIGRLPKEFGRQVMKNRHLSILMMDKKTLSLLMIKRSSINLHTISPYFNALGDSSQEIPLDVLRLKK